MKSSKLICSFCGKREFPEKRKIFDIRISEILYEPNETYDGSKHPHRINPMRRMQICENCLLSSDIQKALTNEGRPLEYH